MLKTSNVHSKPLSNRGVGENSLFFSENGYSNNICFNVSVRFNNLIAEQNPNNFSEEQSERMQLILTLKEKGLGYRRIAQVLNEKVLKLTRGMNGVEIMFVQFLKDINKD